jgi:hypothetical protein
MRNYFGVIQRHLGTKVIYNYLPSRRNINGIKNRKCILKNNVPINIRGGSMIKNTKRLNRNWGKVAIGMHYNN